MKNKPPIKFIIDPSRDVKNAQNFVQTDLKDKPVYVRWFLPKEMHFLIEPDFKKSERDKVLKYYTLNYYSTFAKEIRAGMIQSEKNWRLVEKKYFKVIGKLFPDCPWPVGDYKAIVSIYHLFPRFIDRREFYFPYKHAISKFSNMVIAHEMLHFMFFAYIKDKYDLTEDSHFKHQEKEYVWKVSEVFNNVIERWAPYNKIFRRYGNPYPGCEQIFKKMNSQWKRKPDVKWLLDQWFINDERK